MYKLDGDCLQCFDAVGWVAGRALACTKLSGWVLARGADLHTA